MFQKGDFVTYGCKGVCIITDVTTLKMDGIPKDRLYYEMQLASDPKSRIFTPVEHEGSKNVMRQLLGQEQAEELIETLPRLAAGWIRDDREREARYREVINHCDAPGMLSMIYMAEKRRKEREQQGRKLPAMDSRYLHMAQENLYTELAIALGEEKEEIAGRISRKISLLEASVKNV